ncbi:MAG: hypothetical protein AAFR96_11070, partial [Planctomycetota bacterium]
MVPFWLLRLLEVVALATILRVIFGDTNPIWLPWYLLPVLPVAMWAATAIANRRRQLLKTRVWGWLAIIIVVGIASWLSSPGIQTIQLQFNHGLRDVLSVGWLPIHLTIAF